MNIGLLLVFIGGALLTLGDITMKKWVNSSGIIYYYIIGLLIYLVALNFLAQSYRFKNIAVASMIFVVVNVVTIAFVSWLYFKEPLSVMQIIGILLGIGSVLVLEIFE